MTTIAYRDGVLAADTRAFAGDQSFIGKKQKIYRIEDENKNRLAFGVTTRFPGLSEEIGNWLQRGRNPDFEPQLNGRDFEMLLIDGEGDVFFFSANFVPSGPLTAEYFAIGSGADYALGAMAVGADASQAVLAASMFDVWTNSQIDHVVHIEPEEPNTKES